MKTILAFTLALSVTPAFAADFECSKPVSETRIEGARITSWPHLLVSTSFRDCRTIGDMVNCSMGLLDLIADDDSVCFRNSDVNKECTIKETPASVDVICRNGMSLNFVIDPNSAGYITCSENGVARKTWRVGTCLVK